MWRSCKAKWHFGMLMGFWRGLTDKTVITLKLFCPERVNCHWHCGNFKCTWTPRDTSEQQQTCQANPPIIRKRQNFSREAAHPTFVWSVLQQHNCPHLTKKNPPSPPLRAAGTQNSTKQYCKYRTCNLKAWKLHWGLAHLADVALHLEPFNLIIPSTLPSPWPHKNQAAVRHEMVTVLNTR